MKRKIITIIGSTRYRKEIIEKSWEFTKQGFLVLFAPFAKEEISDVEEHRDLLEEIHKEKIDMADIVFVFNKDKYMGNSTKEELKYAKENNKIIQYLEEIIESL